MHVSGSVIMSGFNVISVPSILLDTGAVTASYMSTAFYNKHIDVFKHFTTVVSKSVRLGDSETVKPITKIVDIKLFVIADAIAYDIKGGTSPCDTIISPDVHTVDISCNVFDTGHDIIVGLPTLLTDMYPYFMRIMESARDELYNKNLLNALSVSPGELIDPFPVPFEEAPEDLKTPLPVIFEDALHFMEMPYEESVLEYRSQFAEHVNCDFAKATKVLALLELVGVKVFVPQNWEGIKGIPPIELHWKSDPPRMKPRPRPINPKLFDACKKEFERLCKYHLVKCDSDIASALVVAPKATTPYVRFCGDYVLINKYIMVGHFPIPHVQRSLEKIIKFKIFIDLDMVNSFHQFLLSLKDSERLSIQTPWGQYRPKFMPEGVGPASGILQAAVQEIFAEFDEWTIVLFDNFLVLAHDYDDAYNKLEMILRRCIKHNLYLKFSKSWLGVEEVNFFGYVCRHNSYKLSSQRIQTIMEIPFPSTTKQMQSFMGATIFFKSFVPHFSTLAAKLNDMTKSTFNWKDQTAWPDTYRQYFVEFKRAIADACILFYPDYTLDWVLRTDASELGIGAVLLQIKNGDYQPLQFISQKFSPQAVKWTTIEQECYAIYFAVHSLSYYLRCKSFVLETDHRNLLWMSSSLVPKIMRWYIYLHSFNMLLRHIPGKQNLVADLLSRVDCTPSGEVDNMLAALFTFTIPQSAALTLLDTVDNNNNNHNINFFDNNNNNNNNLLCSIDSLTAVALVDTDTPAVDDQPTSTSTSTSTLSPSDYSLVPATELLSKVHGGRSGHLGTKRTWFLLNRLFPGHHISLQHVDDYIRQCPQCQKDRFIQKPSIPAAIKTLRRTHARSTVGIDTVKVTLDSLGNEYIVCLVNFHTKYAALYAVPDKEATTTAMCIFRYACTFGVFDELRSDPGSDFTSEVVAHLMLWLGPSHTFTLVDNPQADGVEGSNKQIIRHLKALCMDERVKDKWSDNSVLPIIQLIMNEHISSETGISPLHATFGDADAIYLHIPDALNDRDATHEYVKQLQLNLATIRSISAQHQENIKLERTSKSPAESANRYQTGDFVLYMLRKNQLSDKLTPRNQGPYKVIQHVDNWVTVRNLIHDNVKQFDVSDLTIFVGSAADAYKMAQLDTDQFEIVAIAGHTGDARKRSFMTFLIIYRDGDQKWLPYSKDISDTLQFEEYCLSHSHLRQLLWLESYAQEWRSTCNATPITLVTPGQTVYVDLRSWGVDWYNELTLPDKDTKTYVTICTYGKLSGTPKRPNSRIVANYTDLHEIHTVNNLFISEWGHQFVNKPEYILIDRQLIIQYNLFDKNNAKLFRK